MPWLLPAVLAVADADRTRPLMEELFCGPHENRADPALLAWASFVVGLEDDGLRLLRAPGAAASSALFPAALVHGVLGIRPDAPRHRILIAPLVPTGWPVLDATGIRIADARIDIGWERRGSHYAFRIEQTEGAVPVRAIFEPTVAVRTIDRMLVDGRPADLDAQPARGGMRVPVQLVLDHERRLELFAST